MAEYVGACVHRQHLILGERSRMVMRGIILRTDLTEPRGNRFQME